jgi:HSP90 family molecular chaperone
LDKMVETQMSENETTRSPSPSQQSMEFRAEVQQLLHILAHSLYTEREIFLRELISNASDALNQIQFEMLTNRDVLDPEAALAIRIEADEDAKTVTISDTGIGMTRDELVEDLGTIARSGAMAFLERVKDEKLSIDEIIGHFGVGFYSVFMVAEEVMVTSRSYRPNAEGWSWTSRGENTYTLSPADQASRGTIIKIKLKEDAAEFASNWRLEQIVKKHSDYVSFPIYVGDKVANRQAALWRQSPQEVEAKQYLEFYKQLTLDFEEPLLYVHIVADAPVNMRSILYVPSRRERGLLHLRTDHGLKLFSRKVLIQEYNKDLLPNYLRFVEGVVDSEDLPLNISRESVQSNPMMRQIQRALTKRMVKELSSLAEDRREDYRPFWREFGVFIKEGVATDPASHESLRDLLRFHSSKADNADALVSLKEYVARMKEDQKAIYYVLGDDLKSVAHSPHLDYFRVRDIEVLYLISPIDGFTALALREYAGSPLQNVDDAGLDLPEPVELEVAEASEGVPQADFERLVERFKARLGDKVADVRESKRLTDNPCRLVSPEGSPDRDLHRMRRLIEQEYEIPKKILELNRRHSLIQSLAHLLAESPSEELIDISIQQLFDNALLLEGLHPNPAEMTPRIQAFMETAITSRAKG